MKIIRWLLEELKLNSFKLYCEIYYQQLDVLVLILIATLIFRISYYKITIVQCISFNKGVSVYISYLNTELLLFKFKVLKY